MAAAVRPDGDQPITDINVTPLVDVMLVLLVLLMVTTSVVVTEALSLDLPEAASGGDETTRFSVTIDRDGTTLVDERVVEDGVMRRAARSARARGTRRAAIFADGAVEHRHVVHVMDTLRQEHIDQFAIQVRPTHTKDGTP